jgi:hypothetical protein
MSMHRDSCPQNPAHVGRAWSSGRACSCYQWKVGDVFTNGTNRWKVDSVSGDKAVMRSCSTSLATTRLLTFDEWRKGGRWQLEQLETVR